MLAGNIAYQYFMLFSSVFTLAGFLSWMMWLALRAQWCWLAGSISVADCAHHCADNVDGCLNWSHVLQCHIWLRIHLQLWWYIVVSRMHSVNTGRVLSLICHVKGSENNLICCNCGMCSRPLWRGKPRYVYRSRLRQPFTSGPANPYCWCGWVN